VLHHDGSPRDVNKAALSIHAWHRQKGWAGIGYHAWIQKTGLIEQGRPLNRMGAHADIKNGPKYNCRSWACALAGNYSLAKTIPSGQYRAAIHLFAYWKTLRPEAKIRGHGELPGWSTSCPGANVDMDRFRYDVEQFLLGGIL